MKNIIIIVLAVIVLIGGGLLVKLNKDTTAAFGKVETLKSQVDSLNATTTAIVNFLNASIEAQQKAQQPQQQPQGSVPITPAPQPTK